MNDAVPVLELARSHRIRIANAWPDPTDWGDLSIYGFYCLEAAIVAAAMHLDIEIEFTHESKSKAAEVLAQSHDLPDISELLVYLNTARRAIAFGDGAVFRVNGYHFLIACRCLVFGRLRFPCVSSNQCGLAILRRMFTVTGAAVVVRPFIVIL